MKPSFASFGLINIIECGMEMYQKKTRSRNHTNFDGSNTFPSVSIPDTVQNYRTRDDTTANHGKHARNLIDAKIGR